MIIFNSKNNKSGFYYDTETGTVFQDGKLIGKVVIPVDKDLLPQYRNLKEYAEDNFNKFVKNNQYSIQFEDNIPFDTKVNTFDYIYQFHHPIKSSISNILYKTSQLLNVDITEQKIEDSSVLSSFIKTLVNMQDSAVKNIETQSVLSVVGRSIQGKLSEYLFDISDIILSPFTDIENYRDITYKNKYIMFKKLEESLPNQILSAMSTLITDLGLIALTIAVPSASPFLGAARFAKYAKPVLQYVLPATMMALSAKRDFHAINYDTMPENMREKYGNSYAMSEFILNSIMFRYGVGIGRMQSSLLDDFIKGNNIIYDLKKKAFNIISKDFGTNFISSAISYSVMNWTPASPELGYSDIISQSLLMSGISTGASEAAFLIKLFGKANTRLMKDSIRSNFEPPTVPDPNYSNNNLASLLPPTDSIIVSDKVTPSLEIFQSMIVPYLDDETKVISRIKTDSRLLSRYMDYARNLTGLKFDSPEGYLKYAVDTGNRKLRPSIFMGNELGIGLPVFKEKVDVAEMFDDLTDDLIDNIYADEYKMDYLISGKTAQERIEKLSARFGDIGLVKTLATLNYIGIKRVNQSFLSVIKNMYSPGDIIRNRNNIKDNINELIFLSSIESHAPGFYRPYSEQNIEELAQEYSKSLKQKSKISALEKIIKDNANAILSVKKNYLEFYKPFSSVKEITIDKEGVITERTKAIEYIDDLVLKVVKDYEGVTKERFTKLDVTENLRYRIKLEKTLMEKFPDIYEYYDKSYSTNVLENFRNALYMYSETIDDTELKTWTTQLADSIPVVPDIFCIE